MNEARELPRVYPLVELAMDLETVYLREELDVAAIASLRGIDPAIALTRAAARFQALPGNHGCSLYDAMEAVQRFHRCLSWARHEARCEG